MAEELDEAKAAKAGFRQKIAGSDFAAINADPELLNFALAGGAAAFGDNCAPAMAVARKAASAIPNLHDDSWLWGGSLDAIHETIIMASGPTTQDAHQSDAGFRQASAC